MSLYIPTRNAPTPPSDSTPYLSPSHPFASYYIPPPAYTASANSSTTTLDSVVTPQCSPSRLRRPPVSPLSSSSKSDFARSKSPTGSLASPLSPRPKLASRQHHSSPIYHSKSQYTLKHEPRTGRHTPPSPLPLPTELAFLDHKPKQTLLSDLEVILGKRLTFPFLTKITSRGSTKSAKEPKETVMDRTDVKSARRASESSEVSKASQQSQRDTESKFRNKLRKERDHSWEEEFAWRGVQLYEEESLSGKKGRGVREGNWI